MLNKCVAILFTLLQLLLESWKCLSLPPMDGTMPYTLHSMDGTRCPIHCMVWMAPDALGSSSHLTPVAGMQWQGLLLLGGYALSYLPVAG